MSKSNYNYKKILEEYHIKRNTKVFYTTQGFEKIWRGLEDLIKQKSFQNQTKNIRKEYFIPTNGFQVMELSWIHPPKDWKHSTSFTVRLKFIGKMRSQLKLICETYGFLPQDWVPIFEQYVFYNKFNLTLEPNSHNLCFVSDMVTKRDSLGRDVTKTEISLYPITLHISPHASKRDVLDYVEKIFTTEITPLQKKYHNGITPIKPTRKRKSVVQIRNDFIYENQDWALKDLRKHIKKEFGQDIDEGNIGKIKSLENKKRN